jgi:hypothetical protein
VPSIQWGRPCFVTANVMKPEDDGVDLVSRGAVATSQQPPVNPTVITTHCCCSYASAMK